MFAGLMTNLIRWCILFLLNFTGDRTKIDFQSLMSLADEEIDVSFLKLGT